MSIIYVLIPIAIIFVMIGCTQVNHLSLLVIVTLSFLTIVFLLKTYGFSNLSLIAPSISFSSASIKLWPNKK